MTYLFITHDLAVARQIADRLYVLEHGLVVESGTVAGVLERPTHPYTQRLLASVPTSNPAWLEQHIPSSTQGAARPDAQD